MGMILQIIGAITLLVIAVLALIAFVLFRKWKSFSNQLSATPINPTRIDLQPDPNPQWLQDRAVQQDIQALERLGFARGKAYTIEQMPGVFLASLCHPEHRLIACLYQHEAVGLFADLVAELADGRELTVTNAPMGAEIDTRPESEKIFLTNATVTDLFEEMQRRSEGLPLQAVSNEGFASQFETAYHKDMTWRAERGGVSEAEVRRVAIQQGEGHDEEAIQTAMQRTKLQEIEQWESECLASFEDSTDLSVREWKHFQETMFIFRDDFHAPAFAEYLADKGLLEEDEALEEMIKGRSAALSARVLLNRIEEDADCRLHRLGSVSSPITAEIYGVEETASNTRLTA